METGNSKHNRYTFGAAFFYELIGTMVVTMAYTMTNKSDFLRSVAYFTCYLFAVKISGAHFNPATTIAVYMTEKNNKAINFRHTWIITIC